LIGQTISHYRIVEQLGGGGMGVVYKAEDTQLPRSAALKFLHEHAANDPKALERFGREVRVASSLNHPNICTVYEVGEHEGKPFMAMEFLDGRTLKYIVGEPLPIADVLDYSIQIAKALEAAHSRGIVHRDIKPANIFVCADRHVKVLDFGIALMVGARQRVLAAYDSPSRTTIDNSTTGSHVLGTAAYMSPEQVRGEQLDARSDIFSLGVVIYELATGHTPFPGNTVGVVLNAILEHDPVPATRLNPALPLEVQQIIERCLEKGRETRYQSAADLCADLRRVGLQIETGKHRRMQNRERRTRRAVIRVAVLLALASVLWILTRPPVPRLVSVTQLTNDGTSKTLPTVYYRVLTDGSRLYFTQLLGGSVSIAQVAVNGGRTVPFPATLPFSFPYLADVSPDHSQLLIIGFNGSESEAPLWTVPSVGGDAQRVGTLIGHDAVWHPDGSKITFSKAHEIHSADNLGNEDRVIATLPGTVRWLRWSPDGKSLRFTLEDSSGLRSLWQKIGEQEPKPLLSATSDVQMCCGTYTPDGAYFLFQLLSAGHSDVAVLPASVRAPFRTTTGGHTKLTSGPLSFVAPVTSADGSHLYAIGEQRRGELLRFDSATQHWLRTLPGISAEGVAFSPDGEQVAYVSYPESSLWVMRKDGGARQQLTFPPMRAVLPRWSSNGRSLAFFAAAPGNKLRVFTVALDVQATQHEIAARGRNERDPCWLGETIVYSASDSTASPSFQNSRVFSFDLRTGQETEIPDSLGYFAPRCSPDGRYLTALRSDSNTLALYDTWLKTWKTIATGPIGYVNWGRDSRHVFYDTFGNDASILSVDTATRQTIRVAELSDVPRVWGTRGPWFGLDDHDAPLILRDVGSQEIYALEWQKH
jgi:serine/threonine protein kinase/Tol biopolymer transport system component